MQNMDWFSTGLTLVKTHVVAREALQMYNTSLIRGLFFNVQV
jgi:hypothetical protein